MYKCIYRLILYTSIYYYGYTTITVISTTNPTGGP